MSYGHNYTIKDHYPIILNSVIDITKINIQDVIFINKNSFTIVRNPYDGLLSSYNYKKNKIDLNYQNTIVFIDDLKYLNIQIFHLIF